MIQTAELTKVTIPTRRIICRRCLKEFNSDENEFYEIPDLKDRVLFICPDCKEENKIKRIRNL